MSKGTDLSHLKLVGSNEVIGDLSDAEVIDLEDILTQFVAAIHDLNERVKELEEFKEYSTGDAAEDE